jgi:2-dehydropantoate 2-reductase
MKWSKLLANLIANASSALLDMTPAQIFADRRLFEVEIAALREALAVMGALELRVVDLPGLPTRALAFATGKLPTGLSRPLMARAVGRGRGGKMPSLHIDAHAGRGKSEVDWLNGAVARRGAELGVPTPVNRLLNELLLDMVESKAPPIKEPEALLNMLRSV